MADRRRILLLANPTSGRGKGARHLDAALPVLAQSAQVQVVVADTAQAAASQLREQLAQARPGTQLVALGGDGTVHLALQAALAHAVPLGIIPAGSGNDGARAIGVPLGDPVAAARIVLAGRTDRVDAGLAIGSDGRSAHFLCILSCGFDSAVNERANRMRWPHGRARYVRAVAAELPGFRPARFEVDVDGEVMIDEGMLVSLGNGPSYGGGMLVVPQADLRDGLLSGIWLTGIGRVEFLKTFPKVFAGTHVGHPAVRTFAARSVTLSAPGQVAYLDGERFAELPITVRSCPRVLTVIVP